MRIFFLLVFIPTLFLNAQQNSFFKDEVLAITKKYDSVWDSSKETIVFTGSSSIKMWKNVHELFPNQQIINTGFGGSQTLDLLGYTDELILNYTPKKIFIYEGDNDISSNKKPKEILKTFEEIITQIKKQNAAAQVIIISAKPSIARYHLKRKYQKLNRMLNRLCKKDTQLQFANVWDIMFDKRKLKEDIFINDGLHMNDNGYQLWYSVIKDYIN